MEDNKINLPSSGGGILRYFEDVKSTKLEMKPMIVLIIIIAVVVIELYLYKFGL